MTRKNSARFLLSALLLAGFVNTVAADSDLAVSVSGQGIHVSGVTRGADVVVFGVAREGLDMMTRVHRVQTVVTDSDRDGSIVTTVRGADVPAAVWVAVDLTNGHFGTAAGSASSVQPLRWSPGMFRRGSAGKPQQFVTAGIDLQMLYVHAGSAWYWSVIDGMPDDMDGPGGGVSIDVNRARFLGGNSNRPEQFLPGGLAFIIDTRSLEISILRLDAALLGGQP